ncbi:hypothetical protein KSC_079910 [Ktedonobacter sp. SOSP1-52]|uniref:AAA family ATPase n=1 Tax=Ktedonobacter sp. SOSP1-52 TaxID=2778366 RepID=UPI0019151776|nr:AAA family ATPase [Ktedonobacter sp. SOSP1-52]GHO69099.1 hypothetical protein KSC_079910 [Ktedonobacter sp. SOSP1-52]
MIILKHLTVERFRLLREVNIHFPQRGSILIQGPNESGKSALLESIYFALYGEPMASDRKKKRVLDDLISYGSPRATVSLSFSIGTTNVSMTRILERGQGQQVRLLVSRGGVTQGDEITDLSEANARIVAELGQINGETLRNSCLVEQKGLTRLEDLSGAEREETVRHLLGLEQLATLGERFKVLPEDEQALQVSRERLQLAEMQARIPEVSKQLGEVELALDAVTIHESLDEIQTQETEIAEEETALKDIQKQRGEHKMRQHRVQQLRRADATLAEIISAYDGIAEARHEIPELERQLTELERREQEELPALEKRVSELSELLRSFGTLQRMSNDLLSVVDTIKEQEQQQKEHETVREDLKGIEVQVGNARERLLQAQQSLQDLEDRRRINRPRLEARLERLHTLASRLAELRRLEQKYLQSLEEKKYAAQNALQIEQFSRSLRDAQRELDNIEAEAHQLQQQAEELEKRWRMLSMRRHLEEWQRLKGLSQGLAQAEKHVHEAYRHQEKLNHLAMDARSSVTRYRLLLLGSGGAFIVALGFALWAIFSQGNVLVGVISGVIALLLVGAFAWGWQKQSQAHEEATEADRQMQDAISKVGMMVAARETAIRMGGSPESLAQVEREIQTLGGTIPISLEDAHHMLHQIRDEGESLADIQKRAQGRREEANGARNRANLAGEAVNKLRQERALLEEQRRKAGWDHLEERILKELSAVQLMHQEITLLAGQEGLPLPSVNERLQGAEPGTVTPFIGLSAPEDLANTGVPELESLVEGNIKDTEREMASLDGKLDMITNLAAQVKIHQEALDVLLERQRTISARNTQFMANSPAQQLERTREQQFALKQALQSLNNSLRQRVSALGITFGQAPVSNAELAARKKLEELHISLGNKYTLQERLNKYTKQLRELQDLLAEHYKQLAKYSNTLGSWIVPPNPFAEALSALRERCAEELKETNEQTLARDKERLDGREGAAKAKIALCKQEILNIQERIHTLLEQLKRPEPGSLALEDIVAIWPLLADYKAEERPELEEKRDTFAQELQDLERQELELSEKLQTGRLSLDLDETRQQAEQQERSYQIKYHGQRMINELYQRVLQKVVPRTQYYMQQILPLLTSGRYHDVHLTTDDEEGTISGGPVRVNVWEAAAGEYIPRSALSGGTADQLSLALRLAFSIAALPQDEQVVPGFVLLDEPLSSFDHTRAQTLVDVITSEVLSTHFEQIMLISHSSAFDPAMFPYHLYMNNGLVVESNLPVAPSLATVAVSEDTLASSDLTSELEDEEDEDLLGATQVVAAISPPKK